MSEDKPSSCWMMSTTSGIMNVPMAEVVTREAQGWKKCDDTGNVGKPAPTPLPKKKKDK